jgi:tRNA nucleotidyltransferase/poly(A) polymerase
MEKLLAKIRKLAAKQDVYIVGGWLRDRLLKRANRDLDLAASGSPLALSKKIARSLRGRLVVLDDEHKIYRIVLRGHPDLDYIDVARLRGKTIMEDLSNRDFTINAMALAVPDAGAIDIGRRIDPLGGGKDLSGKTVRMVSPGAFADDPLRLLRAFRLAAELNFRLEPRTLRRIRKDARLISRSAAERIREELFRMFAVKDSADWIACMEKTGILQQVIPEISPMKTSARRFYFHPHGLWQHALETLRSLEDILRRPAKFFPKNAGQIERHLDETISSGVSRRELLKLIALLHDVAKPRCARRVGNRMRFLGHETKGAAMAAEIFTRLRIGRKEIRVARRLIEHHMRPISLGQSKTTTRRAAFRLFRDLAADVPDLFLLSLADCYSYRHLKTRKTVDLKTQECTVRNLVALYFDEKEKPSRPKLADGHLLMRTFALQPGPLIGALLTLITEAQDTGKITTRDEAMALVRKKLTPLKKRYKIK